MRTYRKYPCRVSLEHGRGNVFAREGILRAGEERKGFSKRLERATSFAVSLLLKPGRRRGLQKALMAARLATTAVSLAWEMPSSALDVMSLTFDREPHRQTNLVLFPNNRFGYRTSRSHIPGGITWQTREEWENLVTEFETVFDCTGEVITYVTSGQDAVSRPQLLNVLFQALLGSMKVAGSKWIPWRS